MTHADPGDLKTPILNSDPKQNVDSKDDFEGLKLKSTTFDSEKQDGVQDSVGNSPPPSPSKLNEATQEGDDALEPHEYNWPDADYIIRSSPSRYTEYTDDQEEQRKKEKFASIVAKLNELDEVLTNTTDQDVTDEEESENPPDQNPGELSEDYIKTRLTMLETEASDIKGTMRRAIKKKTNDLQQKIIGRYSQGLPKGITVANYESVKRRNASVVGQPMYTHPGGYKFRVEIWPNGVGIAEGTHISIDIVSLKGDYDAELKFPVTFTVSLQLLNQYRDQDNYSKRIECYYQEGDYNKEVGSEFEFILKNDLYWNAEKETQYLMNDVLRFRVTKIVVDEQE